MLRGQVQASQQVKGGRSLVYDVEMGRMVTLARRDHPFLFLRERTSYHSREIPSVETERGRA